jgi:hypothetical protein
MSGASILLLQNMQEEYMYVADADPREGMT